MMSQELSERIERRVKDTNNSINDYVETVQSIIGFANLFFLDDKTYQPRPNIMRFQGRRLTPFNEDEQSGIESDVFPDLGIVINNTHGILGEVKKNFPKDDSNRAKHIFEQLERYDHPLLGWPVPGEKVETYNIALLVHLTTSSYAEEFCKEWQERRGVAFKCPFAIIEFTRLSQVQEFFIFRIKTGEIIECGGDKSLKSGILVPMEALLSEFARTLLYDAEPPLVYLANVIWVHVVTPLASENPMYESLRKNQKLEILLTVDDIAEILHEGFSFSRWHEHNSHRQSRIPRVDWVRRACEFLVEVNEAEWLDTNEKDDLRVHYRKYDDVDAHFIKVYAQLEETKAVSPPMLPGFEPN